MPAENAVEVAKLAGSVAAHDMSVWGLVAQADMVVKFVMLLLLVSSVVCWSIIFEKWSLFRKLQYKSSMFEKAFRSTRSLAQLYEKVSRKPSDPMSEMFVHGLNEAKRAAAKPVRGAADNTLVLKEKIYNVLHRVKTSYIEKMEKNLIILATVGSASPFIGLFGTVWGIVNSFQAIAATKNTTLAVVAPGIAEALLATAIGLFAAIPAVIFYNLFSNQIRQTSIKLDEYASDLCTTLVYQDE